MTCGEFRCYPSPITGRCVLCGVNPICGSAVPCAHGGEAYGDPHGIAAADQDLQVREHDAEAVHAAHRPAQSVGQAAEELREPLAPAGRPSCMEDKTSEMRDHFDAVEKACELSLQGGTCGVVILGHRVARPHPRVPYGQVWDASACPSEFE